MGSWLKLQQVLPAREWVVLKSNKREVSKDHGDTHNAFKVTLNVDVWLMPKPKSHIDQPSNSLGRQLLM